MQDKNKTSGMTNDSFIISVPQNIVVREAGKGTDKLVNRRAEAAAYEAVKELGISDNVILLNPETGLKISEYVPNARECDPHNIDDVKRCMDVLHTLRNADLHTDFTFDLFKRITQYEQAASSMFDVSTVRYLSVKQRIFRLKDFIDSFDTRLCLTHIDAVSSNFLLTDDKVYLIDWEYAAMQDPDVDIAMFAIYSNLSKKEIDRLIDIYFNNCVTDRLQLKIYAYVAVCGFLWYTWCMEKQLHGQTFGNYASQQFEYAAIYSTLVLEELK